MLLTFIVGMIVGAAALALIAVDAANRVNKRKAVPPISYSAISAGGQPDAFFETTKIFRQLDGGQA